MPPMNMNGWDVVSLVTISFINAAIKAQGSSPRNMQVSTDTLAVQAGFETWQLTIGGSGTILMFDIPLTNVNGTITKAGESILMTHFSYKSLTARVQLVLTFLDGGSKGHQLVVDSKSPPTTVVSLVDSDSQPLLNALDAAFIKEGLTTWFNKNLSKFDHVFASVDLVPATASDAQWAFCKPSVVAYTYIAGDSLANSYLGLTYNTAGKTTPGTVAQIDPTFIPPGTHAAFMISPVMFLVNFLAPATSQQFRIPRGSLNINTSQLTAMLAPDTQVVMDPVSDHQPYLTDLQLAVENSIIKTHAKTKVTVLDEWYGSVTAFNESESWMTLGLGGSGKSLVWTNTQPPINNHWTEQSESFTVIQDILSVVGVVALTVGTVLTDGAALLVVGALGGVAQGGMQWALSDFKSRNVNDAPEITSLVSNISMPIRWAGAGLFEVSQAGLYQGSFFLAGKL